VVGNLPAPETLNQFVMRVDEQLNSQSRLLSHGPGQVNRVAILSGFGADEVTAARDTGADTYLTGETSHSNFWAASDLGLNVIYAGHYATETVGVKALGQRLEKLFGLKTRFLDFPTGM